MRVARVLTGVSFLILGVCSFGQAPLLSPPKQLNDLAWCLGEWSGSMHWTMQGTPESDIATAVKADMDGQFMRQVFSQEMMGAEITETAYTGWNEKDKRFDSWVFTNFGPTPRIQHGTLNGDVWVMESEPWDVMGQLTSGRETVTKVSETEMKFMLEFKNGDKWDKVAEGTFKKKTSAAKT